MAAPEGTTHDCPGGCGQRLPFHLLACRSHWYQLPRELRDRLTRAWDLGAGLGTPEHVAARAACVAYLNPGKEPS